MRQRTSSTYSIKRASCGSRRETGRQQRKTAASRHPHRDGAAFMSETRISATRTRAGLGHARLGHARDSDTGFHQVRATAACVRDRGARGVVRLR